MHPNIRSETPGMCPECGMALVLSRAKQHAGRMESSAKSLPAYVRPKPAVFQFIPGLSKPVANTIHPFIFLPKEVFEKLSKGDTDPFYSALLIHEQAHYQRQKELGLISFGLKYIFSRKFRLSEERTAVSEAMKYLKDKGITPDFDQKNVLKPEALYLWPLSRFFSKTELEKLWHGIGHGGHDKHAGHKDHSAAHDKHEGHSLNMFARKFWVSLGLTIPILLYSPLPETFLGWQAPQFAYSGLIPLILGSIVFFYGGWVFLIGAWRELQGKAPGMMTLIALAIVTAYVYSVVQVFLGGTETLFWELTTLITIMLLGHWMEMRAVQGAQGALRELSKLLPDTAEREIQNPKSKIQIETVSLSALRVGDVVIVRPGGKIPADGEVIEGTSDVNESLATGESKPVAKNVGSAVIAGTINGDGSLKVKVTKIGEATFLAGVMRLVREAQASKSKLQLLSDRAAFYLTVIAVVGGLITLGVWLALAEPSFAFTRMVAVLVIACPHALGLAIPLVASISTTMAARNGFLVKQRLALEAARSVDVVLFDKTGTLTKGEYGITDIWAAQAGQEKEVLRLAAAVDEKSEHSIARAIVKRGQEMGTGTTTASDFKRLPGKGTSAVIYPEPGRRVEVKVGGRALWEESKLKLSEEIAGRVEEAGRNGKTVIYVLRSEELAGVIALGDIIRDESREAVKLLAAQGVEVAMITGDAKPVADWVARELSIETVFAQVLPEHKADKVKELQRQGKKVAMVGDGINDAPALTQADVGIAIGAGTNVAIESAGIILVRNDPRDIPKIIRLSRLTYTKMLQNLFWATGYNVVALPLAAGVAAAWGVVLNPALSAVFMSLSTVIVAANAVLLRRNRPQVKAVLN